MHRLIGKKFKLFNGEEMVSVIVKAVSESGFVVAQDPSGMDHKAHYLELTV